VKFKIDIITNTTPWRTCFETECILLHNDPSRSSKVVDFAPQIESAYIGLPIGPQ